MHGLHLSLKTLPEFVQSQLPNPKWIGRTLLGEKNFFSYVFNNVSFYGFISMEHLKYLYPLSLSPTHSGAVISSS